jgi:hypothetical protein
MQSSVGAKFALIAGDRTTRRRRRTPRARAIDDAPDSGRGFARSFPSPRCFGAPNIASRARAWWSREGARCANAETTRRNFAGIAQRGRRAARSVRTRRHDKAGRTERIGRSRGASRHSARARRARRTPSSRAKKFSFAAETRARRRLARLRGRRRSSRPRSSIVDRSSSRPIGAVAAEKARRRKKKSNPINGMASSPLARASPRWSSPSRDTSSFSSRASSGSATAAASRLRASHLACRAKRGGASTSNSSGFGFPPAAPPNFLGELERLRGAGVDVHDFGVEYMCEGETSERVAELQRYLAGEGHYKYRDGATGYFGPITVRQTASRTTQFAWCTPFLEDFSRRHSSPALPFQRLTAKTFD